MSVRGHLVQTLLVSLMWKICLLTHLRKCTQTIKCHTTEMFIDACAKFGDKPLRNIQEVHNSTNKKKSLQKSLYHRQL